MQAINPKNNTPIKKYEEYSEERVQTLIGTAHEAFSSWRKTSFAERSNILNKVAKELEARLPDLARLITDEMGKPLVEAKSEIEKCAWVCRYYAEQAEAQLAPQTVSTDYKVSKVAFQPIGCVFAIMPWNYPFWQVFRFAAPTLMAGNTALLKHAENVPGCALAIEEIFTAAGLPNGGFTTLLVDKSNTEPIIADPRVRAITLTGSTGAGRAVASIAGQHLKKCVLELGGSDAYLVLEDADIESAVKSCVKSRLLNAGQSCISAKRFIVHKAIRAQFEAFMLKEFQQQIIGDPLDEATTIGPMARTDLLEGLHDQVVESIEQGAECLIGGEPIGEEGAYYPPTILTNVDKGMPAFDEELFGPVAAIIEADSVEHAVELANDSDFGLGGAIFSSDVERAERIATEQIDSGACFINDFVKSDPRLPFGGVKDSGYGRELSEVGLREFVNIKTVCVQPSGASE